MLDRLATRQKKMKKEEEEEQVLDGSRDEDPLDLSDGGPADGTVGRARLGGEGRRALHAARDVATREEQRVLRPLVAHAAQLTALVARRHCHTAHAPPHTHTHHRTRH
jgi:hypothetical protein